jgi:surface antigen
MSSSRSTESESSEDIATIRGSLDEREAKLSGLDDLQATIAPRKKPEEIRLAARLNPQVVSDGRYLQCVPFVRELTGIDIRGNANRWWDLAKGHFQRSRRPEEGSVLVMRGWKSDRRGHVAVVKEILDDRTIVIDHANWLNDGKIYLNAPVRDESLKNDWSKVRVWYTPGEQWGHRIYATKGFIHPTDNAAAASSIGPTFALSR